ncbi:HAMP domain-containing sensor histidine kinase [Paenibacillus sp. MER 99-2]|uniref:HAMP domain-containing sensor histidine kinase n=1 Tax=Paenibacillus sp. MER 99-2 TaxID=2939572 RepID=UPI002041BC82|nr:HAMP domain-containing sensor histidine kinase [Paenibacillus sp. MER 99-2]MCM3175788.1 HAMP domain-containing histidine kinase [Paenibacillus sp. MER 99-2]
MNKRRSFRTTMILLLGLSMLASGAITYGVYKLMQYFYSGVRAEDQLAEYRHFMKSVGDIYFFLLLFIPLAILFFFWFTKPYVTYFKDISVGIRHLANGDFQHRVQISSKDELGTIAEDINLASLKLKEAVERGDFAENSKDQLVVNLAHDLRTPLTSVLGYLDLLVKDDQLTEEQVKHFTSIAYTKSQRLEKLIDDLFEITRMNYGMLPLEKKRLDISELLRQMNEELYPVFEKNKLVTRLHIDSDLVISGDGELLARVFENLLINAARHGKDGLYVDIYGHCEAGQVIVQVMNYGGHIDPQDLPHIFDMYYTGDRSRTPQEGGTGLGLFIAKNIVEQHDGVISAQSDVVRTVFEIRLPALT